MEIRIKEQDGVFTLEGKITIKWGLRVFQREEEYWVRLNDSGETNMRAPASFPLPPASPEFESVDEAREWMDKKQNPPEPKYHEL